MKLILVAACCFFVTPDPDVRSWADVELPKDRDVVIFQTKELCQERLHFECKLRPTRDPKHLQTAHMIAFSDATCTASRDSADRQWWACSLTCSAYCYTRVPNDGE